MEEESAWARYDAVGGLVLCNRVSGNCVTEWMAAYILLSWKLVDINEYHDVGRVLCISETIYFVSSTT